MNTALSRRDGPPHYPHPGQDGVALVVVLLFTVVILMIVVSTTATMSLGARTGGVNERAAYQALLTAESALNTLPNRTQLRFTTNPYTGTDAAAVALWLDGLNPYGGATLTFERVTNNAAGGYSFDAVSTGKLGGATKTVLQSYEIKLGSLNLNFGPRAALTSLPQINANGSAKITGTANDGVITTVTEGGVTLAASTTSINVNVSESKGILVGDYVKISGQTLRVNSVSGTQLNVTPVPLPLSSALKLDGNVSLLLNAVAQAPATVTKPLKLNISNARDFTVGETVTVGGRQAIVTAGPTTDKPSEVELTWVANLPASLPEGTQVFRDVKAMRSARTIDPKDKKLEDYSMQLTTGGQFIQDCVAGSGKSVDCKGAEDPLLRQNGTAVSDNFFTKMLLGLSDSELDAAIPLSASTAAMNNEVRRISNTTFDTMMKGKYTGSGILIVDGDINTPFGSNVTFDGFIYFRGNQGGKMNGSLTVNGAIAVRGGPIEGITSTDDIATDLTGNLTLKYDAVTLRKRMMGARGVPQIETKSGTWRQR
ncbi:PilX N-terminal domain-containing pilus assembly protein [Deinococcus ficus]|uniref:PilX N-terminal domain-containing pilus assembly protein n=1 Tax=Deinococcus ficus TaxID=317577 RepID=UPI00174D6050|nr:PilX N-terminal domain-containing pilus assembly protein [Deinococcus ficus]GHF89473.1 hypothetical protein GCM10017782_28230 [Deinococcus ficus]